MATINPFIPSPTVIGRTGFWAPGGPFRRAFSVLRHAWRAYISYKRLATLSDEALAARRLKRADIGRHVFFDDAG